MKRAILILCMIAVSLCLFAGCSGATKNNAAAETASSGASTNLTVKVLDVGQGDAILVQTGKQVVLIDTSDVDERDKLRKELKKANVKALDKVILTHPHADHIGGMEVLLKEFSVKEVYDNGMPATSPLYRNYMKLLKEKGIKLHALKAGDRLDFGNQASFFVFSPTAEMVKNGQEKGYKHEPNNESVVGKLTFGEFTMLFTGDAEKETEAQELESFAKDLKCKVIKVPHHGSKTSSSAKFLQAVAPEVGIISCGAGNDYGHPHAPTLKQYQKVSCKVYRTDEDGTVTITTDGKNYTVKGEKK